MAICYHKLTAHFTCNVISKLVICEHARESDVSLLRVTTGVIKQHKTQLARQNIWHQLLLVCYAIWLQKRKIFMATKFNGLMTRC